MICPRDKQQMKETQIYGMPLDVCSLCLGVWFDDFELKRMIDKMSFGLLDKNLLKTNKVTIEEKEHFWQEEILECPRDYTKMHKNNFGGNARIHIDKCVSCDGVWVDGYELERIEKDVAPNRLMDTLAKMIILNSEENEKWKIEIPVFFSKIGLLLLSVLYGPKAFVVAIIHYLYKYFSKKYKS